ncbi:hypothetical protein HDR62_03390 [bacterium]|nr:hypothetical protein [bacterium]
MKIFRNTICSISIIFENILGGKSGKKVETSIKSQRSQKSQEKPKEAKKSQIWVFILKE